MFKTNSNINVSVYRANYSKIQGIENYMLALAPDLAGLIDYIIKENDLNGYLQYVKTYADNRFNIDKIATQWDATLQELLAHYPDEDSRKYKENYLVFRT